MTQAFMGPDFLLDTPVARRLFHETAADLPIVDFHNHLSAKDILQNRQWDDLTQIWLEGDHYKWRAMRWNGTDEARITGSASAQDKFRAYAQTVPYCLGNPLYHWTHLELQRYFGWSKPLSANTADDVWDMANTALTKPTFRAQALLERMNVQFVGTTDDPADPLDTHLALARSSDLPFIVAPSFRPDRAYKFHLPGYRDYVARLGQAAGCNIGNFDDLLAALLSRLEDFVGAGCLASDHGLDHLGTGTPLPAQACEAAFRQAIAGAPVDMDTQLGVQATVLTHLGPAYRKHGLAMQFHIGVDRNQRRALFDALGPDVGGDSISDAPISAPLNRLLDHIDQSGGLPRTILYALDPSKNEVLVTTAGNFQDGAEPGKIQAGPAWWFNDQLDGMEQQMRRLAQMGLLSRFIGMLTDSRSFLSFPRHEYYRRLLCRMLGQWVQSGQIPEDAGLLDRVVTDLCYRNAQTWFLPDQQ